LSAKDFIAKRSPNSRFPELGIFSRIAKKNRYKSMLRCSNFFSGE